ncbi:ATP-binding cassette domain-containing protein [soil metagenome]
MTQLLRTSNISFAYGDRPALRDISVSLAAGELVAVIGPNGSGKSTLIRALLGQHRASGSIEWEGRSLQQWRRRDFARQVAYLPQAPTADLDQTVEQAIRLGRAPYWRAFGIESEQDQRVVNEVAQTLDLLQLMPRLIAELSGGQRQRVFVGRCLAQQPAAMLLDEPSTFLDLKHQVELMRLLRRLTNEKSIGVLMASHDLNLAAAFVDRIVLLKEGKVVRVGSPTDVLKPDILSDVYGVAMQRMETAGGAPVVIPEIH